MRPSSQPDLRADPTPRRRDGVFAHLRGTVRLARRNDLNVFAGSLAFFCLFALFPYFILSFNVASFILHGGAEGSENGGRLRELVEALLPTMAPLVTDNLLGLLQKNPLSNWLNTIFLAWSSYELFTVLETVFQRISPAGKPRESWASHLGALVCFLITCSTTVLVILLTTADARLLTELFYLGDRSQDPLTLRVLSLGVSFAALFCGLTAIFKLMPLQPIPLLHAVRASFVFLGLFMVGRAGYQIYDSYFRAMNASFYGGFVSFLVIVVWLYYLASIFLVSAQYALYLTAQGDATEIERASAD